MKTRQRTSRAGLSLLEILLSVFVLSVGLLGMLAVLPYAIVQLSTVNRLDFGGNCGRAAFQEIKTRKFAVDASTSFYSPFEGNPPGGFSHLIGPDDADGVVFHRCDVPVFVDPIIIEKYGYNGLGNYSNAVSSGGFDEKVRFLPYDQNLTSALMDIYIPRLSAEMYQPAIPPESGVLFHNPDLPSAERIFFWNEDVNFVSPASPKVNNPRPVGMVSSSGQLQSLNNYSWFYMLTPRMVSADRYKLTTLGNPNVIDKITPSSPLQPDFTKPAYADYNRHVYARKADVIGYEVDVIVCSNRILSTPLQEVQVNVLLPINIGMGGGSVTISSPNAENLDLTNTRWVLLTCQPNLLTGDPTVFAKWYEVVGAGKIQNNMRELILNGPDIPGATDYDVIIVKGVSSVFSGYVGK